MKKLVLMLVAAVLAVAVLSGCTNDADVVSKNLSKDADNFKVERQIVFYNGITDTYIATVTGKCSVDDKANKLVVICKVGKDAYIKNFLGKSDNVTWFALQSDPAKVSKDRFKIVFKPSTVVPEFEVR